MSTTIPEPSELDISVTSALCLAALVACYFFGVWMRSFVFATDVPLGRRLVMAIPGGLIAMGWYTTTASVLVATDLYKFTGDLGYAMVFGMFSPELLDRIRTALGFGLQAVPSVETVEAPP